MDDPREKHLQRQVFSTLLTQFILHMQLEDKVVCDKQGLVLGAPLSPDEMFELRDRFLDQM